MRKGAPDDPKLVPLDDVERLVASAATLTKSASAAGLMVANVEVRSFKGFLRLVVHYAPAEAS